MSIPYPFSNLLLVCVKAEHTALCVCVCVCACVCVIYLTKLYVIKINLYPNHFCLSVIFHQCFLLLFTLIILFAEEQAVKARQSCIKAMLFVMWETLEITVCPLLLFGLPIVKSY